MDSLSPSDCSISTFGALFALSLTWAGGGHSVTCHSLGFLEGSSLAGKSSLDA